jgi:hypothetical protein
MMAKRQATGWPKDRLHDGQKDRLQDGQKTDYRMAKRQTTGWPKDRLQDGRKKKDKRTNIDIQNIHIKLKIE